MGCILLGIRGNNVVSRVFLLAWGLSLACGVGVVLGLEGSGVVHLAGLFVFLLLTWRCFASEGPRLPLVWARFLFSF